VRPQVHICAVIFNAGQVIKVTVPAGTCGGSGTSATSTTPGGEQRTSTGPGSQVNIGRDGVALLQYTKSSAGKEQIGLCLPDMAIAALLFHRLHNDRKQAAAGLAESLA
jgi:hypothetical protein